MERTLEFRSLGPMQVRCDGVPLSLGTPRQQVVLAALVVSVGEPVSLDQLVYELWGERPPPSAVAKVRGYAAASKRVLTAAQPARNWVIRAGSGYWLETDAGQLDLQQFEVATSAGRKALSDGDLAAARGGFETALGLWRGVMLDGLPRGPILAGRCAAAEQQRLATADNLAETYLRLGEPNRAVALLSPLVEAEPLREQSHALLMRARYRADGATGALEVYQRIRQTLATQLGVTPGPELERLHTAVLNRSPELDQLPGRVGGEVPTRITTTGDADARPAVEELGGFQVAVARSLPPDVPHLVGRDTQLKLIREHLTQPGTAPNVVAVHGRAGVGKSALCIHLAHQLSGAFPHGQLYANLHGMHPNSQAGPSDVLGRFLRLLGVDGAALPPTLDERAELYRHLLADRAALVVLDDAAGDDQVEPLLPGGQRCGVLITSRPRVGASLYARTVELDVLDPASAATLLTGLIGTERASAEPDAVAELAALCGHLPLALQVAGARLGVKPHWSVARLANQMRDEHSRLDHLRHGHLDVRASLTLSYRALHPDTRRLLRHLGDLDLPYASTWVGAALLDTTVSRADEHLEELFDAQLTQPAGIDPAGHTRYRMHDLVRLFANEQATGEETLEDLAAARQRAYGACLHLAQNAYRTICGGDYLIVRGDAPRWQLEQGHTSALTAEPMRWFDFDLHSVAALIRRAADGRHTSICWQLAATASMMFQMGRYFDDWDETLQAALAAVPAEQEPRGHAMLLHRMGWLTTDRTQYTQAKEHFARSAYLFEQAGDQHGEAIAETYLGMIERFLGNQLAALQHYQQALPAMRKASDQGGTAFTLRSIGQLHLTRGEHELAEEYLREALHTYTAAGSPQGQAQTTCWQGMLALEQRQPAAAAARFQQALDLARSLGDRPGEAFCLQGLGRAYQQQGRKQQARQALTEALRLVTQPKPTHMETRIREAIGSL